MWWLVDSWHYCATRCNFSPWYTLTTCCCLIMLNVLLVYYHPPSCLCRVVDRSPISTAVRSPSRERACATPSWTATCACCPGSSVACLPTSRDSSHGRIPRPSVSAQCLIQKVRGMWEVKHLLLAHISRPNVCVKSLGGITVESTVNIARTLTDQNYWQRNRITRDRRDRAGWRRFVRCATRAADHHSWWDRERRIELPINSYEPTRHYSGATELNTAGRRATIPARWAVFTKAAIEHRRMELALCNWGYMFTTSGTWRSCPKHAVRHWNVLQ